MMQLAHPKVAQPKLGAFQPQVCFVGQKGDLGLAKNYQGITFTFIAARYTMLFYKTA